METNIHIKKKFEEYWNSAEIGKYTTSRFSGFNDIESCYEEISNLDEKIRDLQDSINCEEGHKVEIVGDLQRDYAVLHNNVDKITNEILELVEILRNIL